MRRVAFSFFGDGVFGRRLARATRPEIRSQRARRVNRLRPAHPSKAEV
jgi:hypothetical protein